MQQNKTVKNILYIAILTTVVVLTWVASNVWYSLVTPTTPADTNKYTVPIVATFDLETLEQLGNRIQVPVNLSEQGDYLTDPLQPVTGSSSADLSDNTIVAPPAPDPIIEEEPVQEEVIVEETPNQESPEDTQSISPTPNELL